VFSTCSGVWSVNSKLFYRTRVFSLVYICLCIEKSGVPDVFSESLLKTASQINWTLCLLYFYEFLKNTQRKWHKVFDNNTNVLKADYTIKNSNLKFFGLKWDASVSSGNMRSNSCAVNLVFCMRKCILTVKCYTPNKINDIAPCLFTYKKKLIETVFASIKSITKKWIYTLFSLALKCCFLRGLHRNFSPESAMIFIYNTEVVF